MFCVVAVAVVAFSFIVSATLVMKLDVNFMTILFSAKKILAQKLLIKILIKLTIGSSIFNAIFLTCAKIQ